MKKHFNYYSNTKEIGKLYKENKYKDSMCFLVHSLGNNKLLSSLNNTNKNTK